MSDETSAGRKRVQSGASGSGGRPGGPGRPGNLLPETRSFVGRGEELAWLDGELDPGVGIGRLVSLVGVGGVGKTRLAARAAARVRDAYPDGVWLVELSALHTAGLVGLAVVEALRLADQSTGPVTEVVAEWAKGKRLLLILDSCEHVLADCVALAETLLPVLPGLRILVTSREQLGLPGERVLHVDPLPVADDAVALFAERAAAATGFALDDTNRPAVEAVCRHLDGIPLAIELAAVRLSELTLAELHGRLGEHLPSRLDLLTSPQAAGPPRHHTLRTAIGWSHELCAPLERLLWARLSVFAGGFCLNAAEEVCAGGPLPAGRIAGLLARLVEQSIVRRHRTDPARFQFLDTVREFGADWLRALGEEKAVRLRHRDHYRHLAREGCAEWNTGRQAAWCERVLTEHANFRAAMDCALTEPDSRVALAMAADAGFLWRHCGYLRDAQHCLDLVLATDPAPGPDRTRALWARGAVALLQGDLEVAAGWAQRCTEAAEAQGDPVAVVAAAYVGGGQLALSGRLSEAIDLLCRTPRLPVREDAYGAAQLQVRVALSFAHMLRGDHGRARVVAEEVHEASVKCGESWAGAFADGIVAQADLAQGDVRAAVANARTALAGHTLMHNTVGAAMALDVLAAAVVAAGDGHRAARLLGIGERVWELTGRAQMDSPDLIATRRSHELRVRDEIGDLAYEKAYEEGHTMPYEEGLDYAAHGR
ncbi:NB-ARC domain-containing protein [Streptomyces sp. NBC_00620]|uniref:ATP-binding protein n=1 Tax=unclassified Streptomyces TaxID=2593676 RepID=UPI00224FEC2A|nr:NB-ARC domain-containing protein [Streptomyces sp. NBC_00620]MCX4974950.1 NB-ARC domain-containing protein [Streptomyces sp. NBC_00620]